MIRELQKNRLEEIINIPGWKVLIIDDKTQKIISPSIRTPELRNLAVASVFNIKFSRKPISDSIAIYFVEPNIENIKIIIDDIKKDLYSRYNFHFLNRIDRELLEVMGNEIALLHKGLYVDRVYDEFIDFVCVSDNLFTATYSNSLQMLLRNDIRKDYLEKILQSLFSVFFNLKEIPFIENNSFGKELEEYIKDSGIIKDSWKRPLLVIFDRRSDMMTPVEHVWTYNALLFDLFSFDNGRVIIGNKQYDIDLDDSFWKEYECESIPIVAENIEKIFTQHKKVLALQNLTSQKEISQALEKAPELAKRNEEVNTHMNLCLEIIKRVGERKLDDFYKAEQEQINDDLRGDEEDILRYKTVLGLNNDDDKFGMTMRKYIIPEKPKGLISSRVSTLLGSLKKLLPQTIETPLSRFVDRKYHEATATEFLNGECHDLAQISKIVVFSVGGGTFTEYKSLKILEKKLKIPIVYCCDELINWKEFKKQIEEF